MRHTKLATLDAHRLRVIAVEANCDPRTVARVLLGRDVSPMVAERIKKALAQHEPK